MFTEYFKNKNVLITGGLGFLGSNVAHELVRFGANVTIVDNLNPLYGGNLYNIQGIKDKVRLFIDNVNKVELMFPIVSEVDIIYHFAAQVSYIDSLKYPSNDLELNAKMTMELLELCRKHNQKAKIIFSSSRMVLGKITTDMMTEDTPANPLSLYGIHKLTSEKYLQMYYKDFGIPTIICRITNPYGIRQQIKHNKYSLVGWFVKEAMLGNSINIFGDGNQLRDYIYADDIVSAFLRLAVSNDAVGEIVNVGSGVSTRFRDMIESVINVVQNGKIKFIEWPEDYEKIETGDVLTDITKLKKLTGWEPDISVEEGVKRTYEYYKSEINNYINPNR